MGKTQVQVRIDEDLKADVSRLFADMGIDMSAAVRIFFKKCLDAGGLPFSMGRNERAYDYIDSARRIFTVDEIKERLYNLFKAKNIKKAVLFGSYAKGLATEKSDIDIVVDSGLLGMKFVGFIEDVRECLDDKEVDLFDVTHIEEGSRIDNEIKETGILIYGND